MVPIKDLNDYTDKMASAIKDKLFFIEKIQSDVYIDYGCADGTLLQVLDNINNDPEKVYIGYDSSLEMIQLAKSKWNGVGNCVFTNNYDELLSIINKFKKDSITLILSSVLHEILSQGIEQKEFFEKNILIIPVKYIVIRDMAQNPIIRNIPTEYYLVSKIQYLYPKQYKDFCRKYGHKIDNEKFVHLLLKYQYTQNWERELEENYFAFNPEELIKQLLDYKYHITYFERFNVPYIRDKIFNDLKIDINSIGQTHIKMIFQK